MNQSARNNLSIIPSTFEAIAGVHSDGIACTALPHKHVDPTHGKVEVEFTLLDKWTIPKKNICGASTNNGKAMLDIFVDGNNTSQSMQFYSPGVILHYTNLQSHSHHKLIGIRNGQLISYEFDGAYKEFLPETANMTLGRLGILTQNDAGSTNQFKPMSERAPTGVVITSFKYWDGDSLIADLVPCIEKKTGEVCFFNVVDQTFVKNLMSNGKFLAYYGENI